MRYRLIMRSRGGISLTTALALMAVTFLVLVLVVDGVAEMFHILLVPAAAVFMAAWIWAWPMVEVTGTGVVIRNPFRTVVIPWSKVRGAEAKYGLQIMAQVPSSTLPKRFHASGVPGKGGFAAAVGSKEVIVPDYKFRTGPTETVYSDPSVAARIINDECYYHKKPRERPELNSVAQRSLAEHEMAGKTARSKWHDGFDTSVHFQWNWQMAAIQLGLIVAAALVLIFL